MNPQDILSQAMSLIGQKSSTPVPAVFDPIRQAGNTMGQEFASLRQNTSANDWNTLSPEEKLMRLGKAAVSYTGQGVAQGGANGLASSLSVSPPAQLAQYAIGNPDPVKQGQHGIEAALTALTLGKYLQPSQVPAEYVRNSIGQFASQSPQWVSSLMGGIK